MRAHASWRSLVWIASRAIAFSIATSESVATWSRRGWLCQLSNSCWAHPPPAPRLVPEAAATAVDHDADLADAVDAHLVGRPRVEDLINDLHRPRISETSLSH